MPAVAHPISLAHLTVLDTTPPELVTVAAAAGFRTIGIRLTATPSVGVPPLAGLSLPAWGRFVGRYWEVTATP